MKKITSLHEKLLEDMKTAMKNKNKKRLSVIRMARASIKNEEIARRKDLDDQEVIEVVAKEVKQRRDSIIEYEKVGQDVTVEQLREEIAILTEYLPEQLTREELVELVDEVIKEISASSMADMGKVMGTIMPRIRGKADGRQVNEIVRDRLEKDSG